MERAIAGIHDGATVMIGGFGNAGMPSALIKAKRVRQMVCSFPRQADSWHFDALYRAGEIDVPAAPHRRPLRAVHHRQHPVGTRKIPQ